MDKYNLTWQEVNELLKRMVHQITEYYGEKLPKRLMVYGVPRGGIYPACLLVHHLHRLRKVTGQLLIDWDDEDEEPMIVVDDIIDSGATKAKYSKAGPFFALVDKEIHEKEFGGKWIVFPWERMSGDYETVEENIVRVLQCIGEDPEREGLKETPKRVVRSFETLYGGYNQNPQDVLKVFKDDTCNEMVLLRNVEFYSTCEHHMLPFHGKAHIAYIPDGKVIGISKLARILEMYARRLQIQERLGQQVTQALEDHLKPRGAACVLEAQHFCMTSRGVQKQNSIMVTSSLTGAFLEQPQTRAEFLNMIRG